MELNVDIKRLLPALGETTWTGMVAECTENRTIPKENSLLRFPLFAGDL
jgi:hypothetical protein